MPTTTNPCENATLYGSLRFCKGKSVLPGIRQAIYAIPKSDIVTFPVLPEVNEAETMGEMAVLTGAFVLQTNKKWKRIDAKLNKGQIEWESQGEKNSRTFLNKITISYAGVNEDAAGFARQANNDDLVYLVQQRDGKWRLLGNEMFETDTKPQGTTGEGTTGEAGSDLVVEVTDVCPAPFYTGVIETEDGDINAPSDDDDEE